MAWSDGKYHWKTFDDLVYHTKAGQREGGEEKTAPCQLLMIDHEDNVKTYCISKISFITHPFVYKKTD